MALRFWLAALGFHLALGAVTVWLARRWEVRVRKVRPTWLWLLWLLADAMLLSWAAAILAVLATPFSGTRSMFTPVRFAAQALFLEGLFLPAWIAWVHFRAGHKLRVFLPALVGIALLGIYFEGYHREPHDLQVRRHSVRVGSGPGTRTLRILHLSDLQTHEIGPYERRVLREAKALNPDLVLWTGDFIQMRLGGDSGPVRAAFNALLRETDLRPRCGTFAVAGDVERRWREWPRLFAGLPVTCLEDTSAAVSLEGDARLAITGLTLQTSRGDDAARFRRALSTAPEADLRLVIGHSPGFIRLVRPGDADLALAGHTHGGQVVLPFLGPPVTLTPGLDRRFSGGLNDYHGTPLHVSRGIGMERRTAPQVRFLCPPEICLIELRY